MTPRHKNRLEFWAPDLHVPVGSLSPSSPAPSLKPSASITTKHLPSLFPISRCTTHTKRPSCVGCLCSLTSTRRSPCRGSSWSASRLRDAHAFFVFVSIGSLTKTRNKRLIKQAVQETTLPLLYILQNWVISSEILLRSWLPLLVVKYRLINYLLQRIDVLVFSHQQHAATEIHNRVLQKALIEFTEPIIYIC
jgi:hypothetical protein